MLFLIDFGGVKSSTGKYQMVIAYDNKKDLLLS